jgi:hypothetical protein
MLCQEIKTVYFPEDGIKYINTLCDYNVEILYGREVVMGFCLKQKLYLPTIKFFRITEFLDFAHLPEFQITRKHNVSDTGRTDGQSPETQ